MATRKNMHVAALVDMGLRVDRPILIEVWPSQPAGARLHIHPHLEIMWNERPMVLHLADQTWRLQETKVIILPAGAPHIAQSVDGQPGSPGDGSDIAVLEMELMPKAHPRPLALGPLSPEHAQLLLPLLRHLRGRLAGRREPTNDQRQMIMGLLALLRDLGYAQDQPKRPVKSLLDQALETLYARHGDPALTVGDLAKVAHLSDSQFRRVFRQHTGYSPQELLNRVRIRAAHRLIAEGQLKKSAVARHVGYATFSALYRRLRDPNSPVR